MAAYIEEYVEHFKLGEHIKFLRKVISVERTADIWQVKVKQVDQDGLTLLDSLDSETFTAKSVAIATGHHAKPSYAKFLGQDSFKGEIIHSVSFNDAISNGMTGKRVLIVGIGNSAVDVAVNCVTAGRCKSVHISTRSGAWIVPNYIFGFPTDLYACRMFFKLPFSLANVVFETIVKFISGNPRRWNLNPKMRGLQSQPTVSPTLIHHIQRHDIKIVPNIQRIEGSRVHFVGGENAEFDHIILCTGYKIDLSYLEEHVRGQVLDEEHNDVKLFKNVFSPDVGGSLAFIGFVQPASGGVLTMSETQARWFAEICKGRVKLPNKPDMEASIAEEKRIGRDKYYQSARHTIQRDPIVYNDEIASYIGAKPSLLSHPALAWRLLLGSCGAYQWRLQGPNAWPGATDAVRRVPLTDLMHYSGIFVVFLAAIFVYYLYTVIVRIF
ncbi:flavin-containing monooxygenase 5-like isoform X2 [Dreissena polymorpha]|nr:flavin-containing monooxygenase 5-like isoform X2 [Dreissena polymorpha]